MDGLGFTSNQIVVVVDKGAGSWLSFFVMPSTYLWRYELKEGLFCLLDRRVVMLIIWI